MNINEKIGGTSKSTYDFNTTSSSQWEYTNRPHNEYTYCGNSYNTDDEDAAVDPSFMTDRTPSTQHLCTPDNTTTIEVEPTFSELDDPVKLSSLQPGDVIGKEFASVQDAEAFYKNYSLFVGFSIRKDEIRRDRHEVSQLQSWRTVGVKTSQVMDHLVDQSGSHSNVGHTKKDLQNRFDSVRRFEIQTSDADSVISYLTAKSEMDPQFFFNYTLDEEDHFGNLFWADSTSRSDYAFFGDVLAFDATYRTNVYRRPLIMLVGMNHHHSTMIFGFGLLGDETVETYTWLLQTFLVAMHGKMPKSVVTDGDKAMHKAIKTVMPESVR
ncbi:hypothetical protein LWI29_021804 [Acer saccharum]|uniref:MULE transposase domain-containing protein n=1 Tax=Acer saccharum TaxID=4024 RepID=A0AA39RD63_ACESA|nr:hypothetical protein LWI29_021804 [Acer saccharum]